MKLLPILLLGIVSTSSLTAIEGQGKKKKHKELKEQALFLKSLLYGTSKYYHDHEYSPQTGTFTLKLPKRSSSKQLGNKKAAPRSWKSYQTLAKKHYLKGLRNYVLSIAKTKENKPSLAAKLEKKASYLLKRSYLLALRSRKAYQEQVQSSLKGPTPPPVRALDQLPFWSISEQARALIQRNKEELFY